MLYGTLNVSEKNSSKLIIFVHGFTGHINEHIFYNAARFFPPQGFDTFRFNLYGYEKDARKLTETSISEHATDLKTVIEYFRNDYSKIYTIGHSFGGHVVVRTSAPIDASVLWNPSPDVKELANELTLLEKIGFYIEHSNVDILVGKNFIEDAKHLPLIKDVLRSFNIPLKIIAAELTDEKVARETYFKHANNPKELSIIKGSSHCYDENDSEKKLFIETLNWIEKY